MYGYIPQLHFKGKEKSCSIHYKRFYEAKKGHCSATTLLSLLLFFNCRCRFFNNPLQWLLASAAEFLSHNSEFFQKELQSNKIILGLKNKYFFISLSQSNTFFKKELRLRFQSLHHITNLYALITVILQNTSYQNLLSFKHAIEKSIKYCKETCLSWALAFISLLFQLEH